MSSIIWAYGNQGRTGEMEKRYSEFELMMQGRIFYMLDPTGRTSLLID
jgi:hypothetical protein